MSSNPKPCRKTLAMTFRSPSLPTLLATSLVLMHSPGGIKAATYYWDNNDATAGFGTASGIWAAPNTNNATQGWSLSSAGNSTLSGTTTTTTTDDLNFGTGTDGLAAGTITVSGNVSARGITFGNASGNLTLTGGSITLNGGLTRLGSAVATHTINSDIVLTGARQFGANQVNEKFVFGGNISGSGASLSVDTNANGGLITLNGTNSFSGNLSMIRGQLNVNSVSDKLANSALGAGSKIIVGVGGGQGPSLNYTASSNGSTNRDLELNVSGGGGLTVISQNAALTLSGSAMNTAANGNGLLNLSGDAGGGANINHFSGMIQNNGNSTISVQIAAVTPTSGSLESGNWKFSGDNTYSGTTSVANASTLIVGHSNALGTTASGTSVNNNGQLLLDGGISVGTEALTLNSGAGANWNGQTLAALRSYTGNNSWAGAITLGQATTIATNSGAGLTLSGGIGGAFNLTFNSGGDTISSGNITTGVGTLTKSGAGNLTLSGESTYTGATFINAGTLQIGSGGTTGSLSTSSAITNNGTIAFNRSDDISQGTHFSTAAIGGTGALVKNGAGNLTLSAANTYSGSTTVNAGTLTVSGGSAIADTSAVTVGSGGVFNLSASETVGSIAGAGNITLGSSTLTAGGDNSTTSASGRISGTGGFSKTGSGTLTLSGNNTYSGNTTVSAGTLRAGSTDSFSTNSSFSVTSGASLDLRGFNNTIKSLSTSNGTITNSSGSATLRISDALSSTLTANLFTGSLGLQIYGGGTVNAILSNSSSTYSGGTILGNGSGTTTTRWLGSGTIGAGSPGAVTSGIFGTGAITIGATTTDRSQLYFAGSTTINNNIVVNSATGAGATEIGAFRAESSGNVIAGAINANLADATFNAMNGTGRTINITGAISGNSGVRVTSLGAGGLTVTMSNVGALNSYAGNTTIDGNGNATLALGAANQIANGAGKGNLIINNARFEMRGFSETINGLSGNGTVDGVNGTSTLTVGDNDATSTFSGVLKNTAGSLSLTKIGAGTLTLSGNNTYTGDTTVSAGTLAVNGSLASAVTVNSGATLQGSGTLGTLTVSGQLAPGNSIESLGVSNASFLSGSTYAYELDSNVLGGDLLHATGALSIASGTTLSLVELAAGTLGMDAKLTLISYGSWDGGLFTYNGSTLTNNSKFLLGANEWLFRYDDTSGGSNYFSDQAGASGFITMTVVPEPNAAMVVGSLMLISLLRRRRD